MAEGKKVTFATPDEIINELQLAQEPSDYAEDLNLESNPVTILERKNEHASTVVVDNEGQKAEEVKPLTDELESEDKPEPIADDQKLTIYENEEEVFPTPDEIINELQLPIATGEPIKIKERKKKLSFFKIKSPFKPRGSKPQSCTIIERYK